MAKLTLKMEYTPEENKNCTDNECYYRDVEVVVEMLAGDGRSAFIEPYRNFLRLLSFYIPDESEDKDDIFQLEDKADIDD